MFTFGTQNIARFTIANRIISCVGVILYLNYIEGVMKCLNKNDLNRIDAELNSTSNTCSISDICSGTNICPRTNKGSSVQAVIALQERRRHCECEVGVKK